MREIRAGGGPRLRPPTLRRAALVATLAAASVLAGCSEPSIDRAGEASGGTRSVVSHLRARNEGAGGVRPYDSLTDLLGNVTYRMPGRPAAPLTDAVVVGTVAGVERGFGFHAGGEDEATVRVDYDDDRALWRTVHVTVAVEEVLSGDAPDRVVAGFSFGASLPFERVEEDFGSFGKMLLFLQRGSPVFDYDTAVYGTVLDGALLGSVGEGGRIDLPVLEPREESELLQPAATVGELRSAGGRPPRTVRLDATGSIVEGTP